MPIERSFRARIRKDRLNPYVDVPQRISGAFAGFARSGRIRVVGKLGTTPIAATLTPVRGGRHRLYVHGGMRAAAGVGVGDTVQFSLRPIRPDEIALPADLTSALQRTLAAREAFDALTPSHRRELLRYVDDARTPQARAARIGDVIRQARGEMPRPRATAAREKPLWECPRCGNRFVTRNMFHSCKRHAVEDALRGKPPEIRALFERLVEIVQSCGPVQLVPYADRVAFMVDVRFAAGIPARRWLDVHFWLPRRMESERFRRVETLGPMAHVYTVRVTAPQQLDGEVKGWIREAYAVGRREHLAGKRTTSPGR